MRFINFLLVITLLLTTVPFALAQTTYEIDMIVSKGKKSKETDATLYVNPSYFRLVPEKGKYKSQEKQFNFSEIQVADYSHSKKPLLSTGGKITTVILLGVFSIPFFFMKKKQHWLTVRTGNDFAVMKLKKDNFRQVIAEFDTKRVAVKTVDETNAVDLKAEAKKHKNNSAGSSTKDEGSSSAGEKAEDN